MYDRFPPAAVCLDVTPPAFLCVCFPVSTDTGEGWQGVGWTPRNTYSWSCARGTVRMWCASGGGHRGAVRTSASCAAPSGRSSRPVPPTPPQGGPSLSSTP